MEARKPSLVSYPDSDGKPMADNTTQFGWIVLLKENLDAWLPDFVAGDLLWYPLEGDNQTRAAPDVLVAKGRPKGPRGSYRQWEEGGIAPQFVVEVLSPGNTVREMNEKRHFYDRYGVQEYIVIDPDLDAPERALFEVWVRERGRLQLADFVGEYHSALLGIRLQRADGTLHVRFPDSSPFRTLAQLKDERDAATQRADAAAAERDAATKRADVVAAERDVLVSESARLRAKLLALGLNPDEK